ncbi:beta-ketoacyl reductase, partial [Streptomyces oceani]
LDELTREDDLAVFAVFSSSAGVLGSPGQGNYSAANAFLDAYATRRRQQGLPATSLAWGPWSQSTGMTSDLSEADLRRMARAGLPALRPEQGLALFDAALEHPGPALLPMAVDSRTLGGGGPVPPLLRGLAQPAGRRTAASGEGSDDAEPLTRRLAALSPAERERAVLDTVCAQVAGVLGYGSGDEVGPEVTFKELGFDSLTSVELRNRLGTALGLTLPATLIFDYPTPLELAGHLCEELLPDGGEDETPGGAADGTNAVDDATIREALANVPVDALRRSGVLDTVLALAGGPDADGRTDGQPEAAEPDADSYEDVEVDDLVRMVLGDEE